MTQWIFTAHFAVESMIDLGDTRKWCVEIVRVNELWGRGSRGSKWCPTPSRSGRHHRRVCHGKNERSDHGGELVSPRRVRRVSRNPDLAVDSTEASPATNSTTTQHTTPNISVHHTKMSEVTAADRQIVFLDRARKLYSDGKFRPALAAFKEASFQIFTQAMTNDLLTHSHKALLRCPCTRDVLVQSKKMGLSLRDIQISRCHCKDFESLPTVNSPKLAMYTLAKRACTCGSDVFHCNAPSHLNALDGIIATYEKLEASVRARQYATLLIITSPRSPEGYLRLAKALRLRDTEQSPETIARCRWIYRQAIQSVQAHGNQDHTKLKKVCWPSYDKYP